MARVLIMDDDNYILELISEFLCDQGHEIITALDGEDGLEKFKKNSSDIVIVDLYMPKKNGFEVMKEIHHLNPKLPIIAISGGPKQEVPNTLLLPAAKNMGACEIIEKPFSKKQINDAVNNALI